MEEEEEERGGARRSEEEEEEEEEAEREKASRQSLKSLFLPSITRPRDVTQEEKVLHQR